MINIVTFLFYGLMASYAPSVIYPSTTEHVCAANGVPVGSILQLINTDNKKQSSCEVRGKNATIVKREVISVSIAVKKDLHFDKFANVEVYWLRTEVPACTQVKPVRCDVPPAACVADLPKPSLVVCVQ